MGIYKSAAEGAKSKGDDRKARMHQRIVKVNTMHLVHYFNYFEGQIIFFQINDL